MANEEYFRANIHEGVGQYLLRKWLGWTIKCKLCDDTSRKLQDVPQKASYSFEDKTK